MPTITVTVLSSLEGNLATLEKEDFERLLGGSLPNFVLVALDEFALDGYDAREVVIMFGRDDAHMLIQYQAQFMVDTKTFLITMTSEAEEAAHGVALDVYDAFVSTFAVLTEQGNG